MAVVAVALVFSGCGADMAMTISSSPPEHPTSTTDVSVAVSAGEALARQGDTTASTRPSDEQRSVPLRVAVVGDSLTVAAREDIDAALRASGFEVVAISAQEGRRMVEGTRSLLSGADAIRALHDEWATASVAQPDLWVVALGTNDIASAPLDVFRGQAVELLGHIPPDAPVLWMNTWIRHLAGDAASANALIKTLARERQHFGVADWYQYGRQEGMIVGDGVHLTKRGQAQFAAEIASQLVELAAAANN